MNVKKIELLSPAKNLVCGVEAINHGADAVYIGAPCFGARAAVGNSIEDIATLSDYAHRYFAKVYVALNTLLYDDELIEAQRIIKNLYNIGADAIIIQDFGILKLDIPPIALHASTQMNIRTAGKVRFLQDIGFNRVVLARELSLQEITDISNNTDVELEAFVHGALCASYSGQCYISEYSCKRSANRGNCAQYCRLPYTLKDATDKVIAENKYLLSLKDLDRSDYLSEMINAGICSFKIEGRLKNLDYVKNITAFYRQKLDALLEIDNSLSRTSAGAGTFYFTPNPQKTFHRSKTDFLLHGNKDNVSYIDTPKSTGEYVGNVLKVGRKCFYIDSQTALSNGDGLCFYQDGELVGLRINNIEDKKIYVFGDLLPEAGDKIYRNFDIKFNKQLEKKSAERRVGVRMLFSETAGGYRIDAIDETGISISQEFVCEKQSADKPELMFENIKLQLAKTGDTIYKVDAVEISETSLPSFIPSSVLAKWRREIICKLDESRKVIFTQNKIYFELHKGCRSEFYADKVISYRDNIMNFKAAEFYRDHGAKNIVFAFEQQQPTEAVLMQCRFCIKNTLGLCPKQTGNQRDDYKEPYYLFSIGNKYRLEFDCGLCEMKVMGE